MILAPILAKKRREAYHNMYESTNTGHEVGFTFSNELICDFQTKKKTKKTSASQTV